MYKQLIVDSSSSSFFNFCEITNYFCMYFMTKKSTKAKKNHGIDILFCHNAMINRTFSIGTGLRCIHPTCIKTRFNLFNVTGINNHILVM